jgi:hypothetical protein
MKRIYRTTAALLRAAKRKLGGRITMYDGMPVLHLVESGLSGQNVDTWLTDMGAAKLAKLDFRPRGREEEW